LSIRGLTEFNQLACRKPFDQPMNFFFELRDRLTWQSVIDIVNVPEFDPMDVLWEASIHQGSMLCLFDRHDVMGVSEILVAYVQWRTPVGLKVDADFSQSSGRVAGHVSDIGWIEIKPT